jgi:predicted ATPase with chaperone activity
LNRVARQAEDFTELHGQEMARRAVTIAAAGGHNLLILWPFTPLASFNTFMRLSRILQPERR